jgi:tRNA (guanosine-2'-O-)-methyltransferase
VNYLNKKILFLKQFVTKNRWDNFIRIVNNRTNFVTIILEDIYHEHNISACLRSADCFGIQNVNIIEQKHSFKDNKEISMGASKWININRYEKTISAIEKLKKEGYKIVLTSPHSSEKTIFDNSLIKDKVAILFGSEVNGCSNDAKKLADEFISIPMYGFTESYNISVAVALTLQQLTNQIRKSKLNWQLCQNEKNEIVEDWLKKSIKSSEMLEKQFNSCYNLR